MPKTAKKSKPMQPKVGTKVYVHDEHDILGLDYYHNEGEIILVKKDHIVVSLKVDGQGLVKDSTKEVIFNLNDYDLEDFWATFRVMKAQQFCYDAEDIWIAPNGGGGYYSYDSEEDAIDYASKHDLEDEVGNVGRSEMEKAAPEMYVCLHRVLEHLRAYQEGRDLEQGTMRKLMAIFPRIDSACAATEKDHNLKDIIKALNIPKIV